jgi:hypothetical protein
MISEADVCICVVLMTITEITAKKAKKVKKAV